MSTTGAERKYHCGADLHGNNVFLTVSDANGKRVLEKRVKANLTAVKGALEPHWDRIGTLAG
ncbi:MAG: hypothetical protein H7A46_15270 [Verrucomicrobiales bacterium]|nr:hypothetical protein [Verrucomicrobiales bacterium]